MCCNAVQCSAYRTKLGKVVGGSLFAPNPGWQVQDYIAKGGDVNKPDRENCSPLMWACWGGHVEIVKRLLDEGARRAPCYACDDVNFCC